ncbi:hypothetical protein D5086_020187 [Populus alba]|uniref:Uncharacterized protein n=1 Tax=Populus alba TaxID=43335 RepID=A0ACC4BJC4_POPAL
MLKLPSAVLLVARPVVNLFVFTARTSSAGGFSEQVGDDTKDHYLAGHVHVILITETEHRVRESSVAIMTNTSDAIRDLFEIKNLVYRESYAGDVEHGCPRLAKEQNSKPLPTDT